MLRSRKYITNNIRRYTHTHKPSSYIKDPILDEKMDKIMSKLEMIDFFVKLNYAIAVIPGLFLFFK